MLLNRTINSITGGLRITGSFTLQSTVNFFKQLPLHQKNKLSKLSSTTNDF